LKFRLNILQRLKLDLVLLLILFSVAIASRLLLILNAPFVYFFDSYSYIAKAIDLFSNGSVQFGIGMPFIIFLGLLFGILRYFFEPIFVARLLMLLTTVLLIYFIYSLGVKMTGKVLGFLAGLIAIFEPYSLSFSIVPHSDVFAIAMGLPAIYFATSSQRSRQIWSAIFFYIAVLTKPELFLVCVIPILLFYFYRVMKMRSIKASIPLILGIVVYILPALWLYVVARSLTRFDIIQKFGLFLTPELLQNTLDLTFRFYDDPFLNQAIFVLFCLGISFALLNIFAQFLSLQRKGKIFSIGYRKEKRISDVFLSDGAVVAFCILLVFVISIIVVTAYGYGYVIVEGKLIITKALSQRYLILPRLLLSYPLAYTLFVVVRKVYAEFAHKK